MAFITGCSVLRHYHGGIHELKIIDLAVDLTEPSRVPAIPAAVDHDARVIHVDVASTNIDPTCGVTCIAPLHDSSSA